MNLPLSLSGNSNLVYTIIRKRNVFHQLANLPSDQTAINHALAKRGRKTTPTPSNEHPEPQTMEGALPPVDAEPGTLKASLAATPGKEIYKVFGVCYLGLIILFAKKNLN